MDAKHYPVTRTEAEWRKLLTPEQYEIMREHGTEAPDSCALNFEKRSGKFVCAGCDQTLFVSKKKFESGHVFDDGPPPTGLRYCINGVAMKFLPE